MNRPTLVKDWEGGYVQTTIDIPGHGFMPAGKIYRVESAGITASFMAQACSECGFRHYFTIKGRDKFRDFIWLGYEKPENF